VPRLEALIEDMSYPVSWEGNSNFDAYDRTITKLHNDNFRKICSAKALEGHKSFRIKFRVLRMGTISIGLVPENRKGGWFIEDR
jgi:hypothetical protein